MSTPAIVRYDGRALAYRLFTVIAIVLGLVAVVVLGRELLTQLTAFAQQLTTVLP